MKLLYGMFLLTCLFVFVFHFELFGSFAWHEISIISGEFGYCPFHQLDFELILSNRMIENLFRVYIASSTQERGGGRNPGILPIAIAISKDVDLLHSYCAVNSSFLHIFSFLLALPRQGRQSSEFRPSFSLLFLFGFRGKETNSKAKFGKVFSITNICYLCLKLLYERCKCFEL